MESAAPGRARLLLRHLLLLGLLALLCWYGCPFSRLLGISCPGCGLTRAWLCFLQGRWEQALAYHALFLPAPAYLFVCIHRRTPMAAVFPGRRLTDGFLVLFTLLLAGYHLLRTQIIHF